MRKLLIITPSHLASAPRAQKEARAAIQAGLQVFIRCAWWDDRLAEEDIALAHDIGADFDAVSDFRPGSKFRHLTRLKQRFAKELFLKLRMTTPRLYGAAAPDLLNAALRLRPDLTMVHSEAGMWVCHELLRRGMNAGVDFDDWFSEDLPIEDRVGRPVQKLRWLERTLLRDAKVTLTTTSVMAQAMAADAGTDRVPLVIPNAFPACLAPKANSPGLDQRTSGVLSLYWFSQTIGKARGLETLAEALIGVKGEWQLHLRGELRQNRAWFEETFPCVIRDRVILQPSVSNAALPAHSSSHDLGLALELPINPSRDLTATNKIFEYLRSGLAVLATSTAGQKEIMDQCPNAGWVVPPGDVLALRAAIQNCVDNPILVTNAKSAAYHAGQTTWAWEPFALKLGQTFLQHTDTKTSSAHA